LPPFDKSKKWTDTEVKAFIESFIWYILVKLLPKISWHYPVLPV
jgi:hypothetical protein